MTATIFTLGTSIMLLLSLLAAALGLLVVEKAFRVSRRWDRADEEERYELEKEFYVAYAVVCIVLAIRIFSVPLYFWVMQTLAPTIPGAMCLWGIFNALPELCWSTLTLKFGLPVLYFGWLILARINNSCKRNPLMKNLMSLYVLLSPLLMIDSLVDLTVFSRLNPMQVVCCTSAIDVWQRPVPSLIAGISGQLVLLLIFLALCLVYASFSFASQSSSAFEWPSRIASLALLPVSILATTEVLTPWILKLPLHHCPFCLLYRKPASILFLVTLWFSTAVPWWILMTKKMGREDEEANKAEFKLRGALWKSSGTALVIGLTTILTLMLISLA